MSSPCHTSAKLAMQLETCEKPATFSAAKLSLGMYVYTKICLGLNHTFCLVWRPCSVWFLWLQDLTASLPASPAAGAFASAPAPVKTPLTGKKRPREGTEGGLLPSLCVLKLMLPSVVMPGFWARPLSSYRHCSASHSIRKSHVTQ